MADPVIRLWVLRILVPLGGYRELLRPHGFASDALAAAIGLGHWIEPIEGGRDPASVLGELRQLHRKAEREAAKAAGPQGLRANVQRLAGLLGLGETDCRILEFAIAIHNERLLDEAAELLGQLSSRKVCDSLATILDLPEPEVRAALGPQGILARSGLVSLDDNGAYSFSSKIDLLSRAFAGQMAMPEVDPITLLRGTVSPVAPGNLRLADYSHVQRSMDILRPYLAHVLARGRAGVNIFLYGAPGTGKSELARTLAAELGCGLYEVASEDEDGDPIRGERRLRALRAAQCFFGRQPVLLAFDEAEDVFNDGDGFFGLRSTAQRHKAWINRMLEDNRVPVLWMSNTVDGLDAAFVRRFDMVFELPVPPKKQRERILREHCGGLLDERRIARLADAEALAPAVIARASAIVHAIRGELAAGSEADSLEHLLGSTLEAQGHRPPARHDPDRLPELYDPRYIHADADPAAIASGLARERSGRLCLYGPPGTGKTAYGRWIAEQLAVPLHVKRGSDLLSMWVGGTERNIARAFQEAEAGAAVLLIDEVDGFLRDRRGMERGWEVTAVNEMLTRMESFPGVFIASTNLMEGLDQAALRRFDLKLKFDFLRAAQAWDLLCSHCAELGLAAPVPALQARLARLQRLTPGDFATIRRQHRLRPVLSAEGLVAALEGECAVKEGSRCAIGFV